MARPRKPVELLKLQNTYQPCRHAGRLESEGEILTPPDWLSYDEKTAYNQFVEAFDVSLLSRSDSFALALLATQWVLFMKAHILSRDNMTGLSAAKTEKQNVHLSIRNAALVPLMKLLAEFGMTPISRQKFNMEPEEERDPLMELIAEKNAIRKSS